MTSKKQLQSPARAREKVWITAILGYYQPTDSPLDEVYEKHLKNTLKRLDLNHFLYQTAHAHPVYQDFKSKLFYFEKIWNSPRINSGYATQFEQMKNHNHFTSIAEIEASASAILQKNFSFNKILDVCDNISKNHNQKMLLDLYNFLINSKIFQKEQLLHLIYPITCNQLSDETTLAYTMSAYGKIFNLKKSAMIGLNFAPHWCRHDEEWSYYHGEATTSDDAQTFVHEFGHVICLFYNLSPEFHDVLNKNITDLNRDEEFKNKIKYHFLKNFTLLYRDNSVAKLVNQAIDYVTKAMVNKDEWNGKVWNTVAKLVAVPSLYGRTLLKFPYTFFSHPEAEWFAEGFAYYFLTPPTDREKFWDIWHEFFTTQININQKPSN